MTLIQAEHLPVISALCGAEVTPDQLRRNVVVSGVNLASFRKRDVAVGGAVLHVWGPCPPCSRMEEELGPGGYQAVRHHGGWYAEVVTPGEVALGDPVRPA
ncbi:MAG: MOSC domain-containing protein [Pseudomonadota bacterium]